jgi:hypothetical protein
MSTMPALQKSMSRACVSEINRNLLHTLSRPRRSRRSNTASETTAEPTLEIAKAMPLSLPKMDNASLVGLGALGLHAARQEILKRHIMAVDNISYSEACRIFDAIERLNHAGMYLLGLPFQIGVIFTSTAAFCSIPLVFHLPTVELFNSYFVTDDEPPASSLQTPLEVSIWSWNWMEPQLGTFTFVLLCMQYMRCVVLTGF